MSPKKESTRNKKSLSRMVLEANAFAKTKQVEAEKMDTDVTEEKTETVESTPMKSKSNKTVPSFMDVTFSPIVNKSVLQSSSESFFSVSTEKHSKADDEEIKPLPAFTTINETYMERSVLHSYESSVAETSAQEREEVKSEVKSLTAFTTINEDFGKSVLHSFESSVEVSVQEKEIKKIEIPQTSFKISESDGNKPVLSEDSTIDASNAQNLVDSSIMTSDSEVDVNWKSQETARVMKEKERIVEIEREINEIEGEMSDECRVESDSEVVEESSESSEDNGEDEEESNESSGNGEVSMFMYI